MENDKSWAPFAEGGDVLSTTDLPSVSTATAQCWRPCPGADATAARTESEKFNSFQQICLYSGRRVIAHRKRQNWADGHKMFSAVLTRMQRNLCPQPRACGLVQDMASYSRGDEEAVWDLDTELDFPTTVLLLSHTHTGAHHAAVLKHVHGLVRR